MGGGSSTTRHLETTKINQQVHNTNNNDSTTTNNYHINKVTTNTLDGNSGNGRSVSITGGANAGLRCIGLPANSPACHAGAPTLQDLVVIPVTVML